MALAARALLLGLTALAASAFASSDDVFPGSPAPALSIKTWYKGTPVAELDKDKTYVVEFWATWCGPCVEGMPHLSELARANKDVTFIGVGIWEDDKGGIKPFVDKMGAKMDYNVAYSGNKDGMAKTWMEAAGQNGIPCAFVVKEGKVAWVGHPMELDKPLAEIKSGAFDVAAFKVEFDKRAEAARKEMALYTAIAAVEARYKAGERAAAKAGLAKIAKENPGAADSVESVRFDWLATESPKAWDAKAKAMSKGKMPTDVRRLCSFAVRRAMKPAGYALARRAMALALAPNPNDRSALSYAVYIYGQTGDTKSKLDATKRILALLPKEPTGPEADYKLELMKDKEALEAKLKGR